MNGKRATWSLFIRKAKKWTQLLSTQVTSFIEPYFSKTDNDSISKDIWKQNLDGKILLGVLSTDVSKKFDLLHSPLLIAKLRAYGHSYGMYSKMICIIWWKNVHYSRTPTTINCHMLLRRLKRLSQFWTKKGTKCPSGMTKIFWKVTSPNIKPLPLAQNKRTRKSKYWEQRWPASKLSWGSRGYGIREGKRRTRACTHVS